MAQMGSRVIALLLTPRPRNDPLPIVQEAGWASGLVWTGAKNLCSTGIRFLDHAARSESLYRLSYRGPHYGVVLKFIFTYVMVISEG
jgi:hypothetical protein